MNRQRKSRSVWSLSRRSLVVSVARQRDDIDASCAASKERCSVNMKVMRTTITFFAKSLFEFLYDVNSRKICGKRSDPDRQYVNFYVVGHASDGSEVIVDGAGHLNFTDLPMVSPILGKLLGSGDIDSKKCIEKINLLISIILTANLKAKRKRRYRKKFYPSLDYPNRNATGKRKGINTCG